MEILDRFIISAKYGPLKYMFKLHFQIWTLPDIKLLFGHEFLSFYRDIHFEDSEGLSQFIHKIKFEKTKTSSPESTYPGTSNMHMSFFLLFFFSVYISEPLLNMN